MKKITSLINKIEKNKNQGLSEYNIISTISNNSTLFFIKNNIIQH